MTEGIGPHLLGWRAPESVDERDALMARALELAPTPSDATADLTIREAYAEGYFSSWHAIYVFWRWVKAFFGHHPTPPPIPPPTPTARLWNDPDQLDQGQTGHCVGFAATQFLNCDPIEDGLTDEYGHDLYYSCKILDGEPGQENGSTVHSAAKVLKQRGRIGTYVWARSLDDVKQWVLTQGPVDVGSDWYDGMFTPDAHGFVSPSGAIAGGHSYLIVGYDPTADVFTFQNSWGASWGDHGRFHMTARSWGLLFNSSGAEALGTTELPLAALRA